MVAALARMVSQLIQAQGSESVVTANVLAILAHIEEWGQNFERMYQEQMGAMMRGRMMGQKAQ